MRNLPQQIKDRIAKEAKAYAFMNYVHAGYHKDADINDLKTWPFAAQVSYNSIVSFVNGDPIKFDNSTSTWAERGQKLADALRKIEKIYPGDTTEQTLSNILLAKTYATNALSEWNQSINKEESVKHPPAKNMGTCQRCDINPATTTYSDLKVCDHCDKMLNDEFDREYQ